MPRPQLTAPLARSESAGSRAESTHVPQRASTTLPHADWKWTVKLFASGHSWAEVQQVRRMSDEELATSLAEALKAGQNVLRSWLSSEGDALRTSGQQRLLRELQRRTAAGIR